MAESKPELDRPRPLGRFLMRTSEVLALMGGFVLLLVMVLTVFSVIGRTAFNTPLLGDSEIVEVGVAFSIFSFLAYCQMRGSNVIVDFFTKPLPQRMRDGIDAISNLVFAAVVTILTWRLALGGLDTFRNGDFSMFLQIPAWWGYVAAFVSCVVWAAACLYTSVARVIGIAPPHDAERV
jgi:TRAP-type C4-dicarboxylate transport system permease small subunit